MGAGARRLSIIIATVVVLAACGSKSQPPHQHAAIVPTISAAYGTVHPQAVLSGVIAPLQNVGITSTLSEPTDDVYVREGDHVHRGQLLALLNTADLRAQLAQYEATIKSNAANASYRYDQAGLTIVQNANTVNQARAALRQAQQTLANDTQTLTRYAVLLANGYVAQLTYDQQATLVKNDQQAVQADRVTLQNDIQQVQYNGTTTSGLQGSQVVTAQAQTQISEAQAQQVRVMIQKASIVSPIDGVVVNRNLNPGEYPGTRQIFTLQQTDHVFAVLNGSAEQIGGMRIGAPATVTLASIPGRRFTGSVNGILNAINPGSTNIVVKVVLANPGGILRAGAGVSSVVNLPSSSGIRIPDTAFLDTTNSTVQVIDNSVVRTANVTMLADDGKDAIVTGLPAGSAVVINGQSGLSDGQTVESKQVAER